jgi:protein O-GlcNAc transferase
MKSGNESIRGVIYLKLAETLSRNPDVSSDEVEKHFSLAIENAADTETVLLRWASFLKGANRQLDAIDLLESSRWDFIKSREFFLALGNLYSSLGKHQPALDNYREALAQGASDAVLKNNIGITLFNLKKFDESEKFLLEAIILDVSYELAYRNLIHLYSETRRWGDAVPFCHKYYSINPGSAAAELLSTVVRRTGDYEQLSDFIDEHLVQHEPSAALLSNFAGMAFELGEASSAYLTFLKAAQVAPESFAHRSNALLAANHYWNNPEALFSEHVRHCAEMHRVVDDPNATHPPPLKKKPSKRNRRIGYLSTDFKNHAVMQIFGECLNSHNCRNIDYYIYNLSSEADSTTKALKESLAEIGFQWRDISGKEIEWVKDQVRSDQIDLIVDLCGHTAGGATIPLLAAKLAPYQATYLGYPNTTGLSEVDYRITDSVVDPVGLTEAIHTEELVRIEAPFLCIQRPENLPEKLLSPAVTNGYVTFGFFNKLLKLTDETLSLWGRLFQANATSRLVIKAGGLQYSSTRSKLGRRLLANGIALDRVKFLPHVENHLEQYNKVDICLDPFPYNGTVNSIEALWMGVPILTLAGKAHVGRVGASLLSSIGLGELIAETEDQYLRIAEGLCSDLSSLAEYKQKIRAQLKGHLAADPKNHFSKLEAAYMKMLAEIK